MIRREENKSVGGGQKEKREDFLTGCASAVWGDAESRRGGAGGAGGVRDVQWLPVTESLSIDPLTGAVNQESEMGPDTKRDGGVGDWEVQMWGRRRKERGDKNEMKRQVDDDERGVGKQSGGGGTKCQPNIFILRDAIMPVRGDNTYSTFHKGGRRLVSLLHRLCLSSWAN